MKKLLYIVISILFVACSKEDEPVPQNYTSVVFVHNVEAQTLRDCSVGYFTDGVYTKIADLGDMAAGRYTQEIELADDGITEICLFVNYSFPLTFAVRKDTKNVLEVDEGDVAEMLSQGADVHILKKGYELEKGRYQPVYYHFVDDDVVCFYIDLTQYGKIILEVSRQLLGQRVAIEKGGNRFWFFSMGGGSSPFQSFKNTYTDFEGYAGWFMAGLDEETAECSLDFEWTKEGTPFAKGKVSGIFEKITPTE